MEEPNQVPFFDAMEDPSRMEEPNRVPFLDGPALPTLKAGEVRLRWLTADDVDDLLAVFSDPEVVRYWSQPAMTERRQAVELLERIHAHFERRDLFQWGLVLASDDRVRGTCTLAHLDATSKRAEIGYALGREHWGRGLMARALPRLLDFAFDELDLRRIEADVDPRNARSIRSLERLGFAREGLLRERWIVHDEVQDTALYGLLRREWRARRG
jgi:RimJ/RimL family protein N-acetyltransferase